MTNHPTPPLPVLTPYLAVHDTKQAIEFYQRAFGAQELFRLVDPQSGKIGHAEVIIQGALLMLADEYPKFNQSPSQLGGTTVRLSLMVDDVDASVKQAVDAGATMLMPPTDMFYGHRSAGLRDPFGHEWTLQSEIEKVSYEEMQRRWDTMVKAPS